VAFAVRETSIPEMKMKHPTSCLQLLMLAAVCSAGASARADNLLANPSFEDSGIPFGQHGAFVPGQIIGPGDGSGWTVLECDPYTHLYPDTYTYPTPSDGQFAVYLSENGNRGTITQTLTLDPARLFRLSFDCASISIGCRVEIDVLLNGQTILPGGPAVFETTSGSMTYQTMTFEVQSSAAYTISVTQPSGHTSVVDNFRLVAICLNGCCADVNSDGQVDFFDYLDFVAAFNDVDIAADFNGDATIDFFDYLDFAAAFDAGCE
jgi:hypothetical protein